MSQGADPNDEGRYKPLVEQFNAKATGVTVDHIQGDAAGSAVAAQGKVIALAAAGTPPDIFWTHAYVAPNLAKLGLTADINPFVKKDKEFKLANLFEAPVKDYDFDGKQTGLPREATTLITIINKEMFQKNGVALPRDNWTWDDFLKAAQSMTKGSGSGQTYGTAGFGGLGSALYNIYPKVWQEGGDVVNKERTKMTLHQAPAVDQVQWIADLVSKHRVHPTVADLAAMGANAQEVWNTGRIGMYVQICVYTSFNKAQFDWDIAPLPQGKTKSTRTASAGHSMTVGSKNKDAAWEWMRVLHSKASYEHWSKTGLTVPTFKEVAQAAVVNPSAPPKSAKIALDAFTYARSEPIAGDWGNFGSEINTALAPVWAGTSSVQAALTPIVQQAEAHLTKVPGR